MRLGGEQPLRNLDLAHLEREERDRGTCCCCVDGEVERERGLADAGSGTDDHHLAGAQAEEVFVDFGEARAHAERHVPAGAHLAELEVELAHDLLDGLLRLVHVTVGDLEKELLGLVDDLLRVLWRVIGERGDLRGCLDHLAQGRVSVKHRHVPTPPREGERVVAEVKQVGPAADAVELPLAAEIVGEGDHVDGEVLVEHLVHGTVDLGVARQVEVIGTEVDEAFLERLLRDHHRREDRRLRLGVLGHRLADHLGHARRVDVIGVLWHGPLLTVSAMICGGILPQSEGLGLLDFLPGISFDTDC